MTQNSTSRENDIRFANLVIAATNSGRTFRRIGMRRGKCGIKLRIAGLWDFTVSPDKLNAMKDGDLLVLGRPNSDTVPDIPLVRRDERLFNGGGGIVDNKISRIQCIIRRTGIGYVIYDCGINGTKVLD